MTTCNDEEVTVLQSFQTSQADTLAPIPLEASTQSIYDATNVTQTNFPSESQIMVEQALNLLLLSDEVCVEPQQHKKLTPRPPTPLKRIELTTGTGSISKPGGAYDVRMCLNDFE